MDEKKKRLGILVTAGPYTFQHIDTAYFIAKNAVEKGIEVNIFLFIDGVIALSSKIKSPGERHIPTMLRELASKGVKIVGCGDCAQYRSILKENLFPEMKIAGIATLAEMVENCDRFITLRLP